jgi:drug/metabolite transporter (DMT)-like permease
VFVNKEGTRNPLLPELALVAATITYGGTFKIVQDALDHLTPAGFLLLRFIVGTIALTPFALRRGWRRAGVEVSPRSFVVAALGFGVVGFTGYWLQNVGLERTTTSNAAFITGLFVVFTPLVETVVTRRAPGRNVLIAVVVSAVGLFLLTGASLQLGAGDALELG